MTPQERTQYMHLRQACAGAQQAFDRTSHQLMTDLNCAYAEPVSVMQRIVRHTIADGMHRAAEMITAKPEQFGELQPTASPAALTQLGQTTRDFSAAAIALNQAEQNLAAFEQEHLPRQHLMPEPPSDEPDMEPER